MLQTRLRFVSSHRPQTSATASVMNLPTHLFLLFVVARGRLAFTCCSANSFAWTFSLSLSRSWLYFGIYRSANAVIAWQFNRLTWPYSQTVSSVVARKSGNAAAARGSNPRQNSSVNVKRQHRFRDTIEASQMNLSVSSEEGLCAINFVFTRIFLPFTIILPMALMVPLLVTMLKEAVMTTMIRSH